MHSYPIASLFLHGIPVKVLHVFPTTFVITGELPPDMSISMRSSFFLRVKCTVNLPSCPNHPLDVTTYSGVSSSSEPSDPSEPSSEPEPSSSSSSMSDVSGTTSSSPCSSSSAIPASGSGSGSSDSESFFSSYTRVKYPVNVMSEDISSESWVSSSSQAFTASMSSEPSVHVKDEPEVKSFPILDIPSGSSSSLSSDSSSPSPSSSVSSGGGGTYGTYGSRRRHAISFPTENSCFDPGTSSFVPSSFSCSVTRVTLRVFVAESYYADLTRYS